MIVFISYFSNDYTTKIPVGSLLVRTLILWYISFMWLDKIRRPVSLPFRMCFIILLMFIAQGIIVELLLFSITNYFMSSVPVRILPKVSGILFHFNHYYLPIFLLTSFIFAMAISLFVRRLTAPVERIRTISGKMASGEYGQRITLRKGDDLYEIAKNINRLAGELEGLHDKIGEISESLEQYSKIGYHLCNIIEELKGLSEEHERSLREDGEKISKLSKDIEEKNRLLKDFLLKDEN